MEEKWGASVKTSSILSRYVVKKILGKSKHFPLLKIIKKYELNFKGIK